jgi:cobalt/nickel transport system permease protein
MSLLSEIFSDIFARQDNWLSRVDARTKLIVAVAFLIAVIFSSGPIFPLLTLCFCVGTALWVGLPARLVALRLAAPMGIAIILFLLQSVLNGSTPLWSLRFHGWEIGVTREGTRAGMLLATRVLGSMSVVFLLSSVTPAHRIFSALRALGVPREWVELALLMYRYVFVLLDIAADLTSAQKVRLGYSNVRRGLSSAGIVAGTLLLRSVDQAVRTHEAMQARACRGSIPIGPMPPMARRDLWLTCAALLALCCLFVLMEIGR